MNPRKLVSTFSIVGYDPVAEEWGIAVASKFLAVGAVVPWLEANVGAIATQAWANLSFGPDGLAQLRQGVDAQQVTDKLIGSDEGREHRQLGVVDRAGRAATFTGNECFEWAGGIAEDGFAIQGNILAGPQVVQDMRDSFLSAAGPLADRLLAALIAGDRSGGDRRGRQSAAIVVVREKGGYGGHTDRAMDLRVDDHTDPVAELIRLRGIHRLLLERPTEDDVMVIDSSVAAEIQHTLKALGAYSDDPSGAYDEATAKALRDYMGTENLEERWLDGDQIDRNVLQYLRDKERNVSERH